MLKALASAVIHTLGFRNYSQFLSGALGIKLYSAGTFQGLALASIVTGCAAFTTNYIWSPPRAMLLLIFLDLANGRYGYQVAKKIRGERFSWEEFKRTGATVVSTIVILGCVRNAIISYPYIELLADMVFGWLFTTKAQKMAAKMVALKVQEKGAAGLFSSALGFFLKSRAGEAVVDAIQRGTATGPTPSMTEEPAAPYLRAASDSQLPPNPNPLPNENTPPTTPGYQPPAG